MEISVQFPFHVKVHTVAVFISNVIIELIPAQTISRSLNLPVLEKIAVKIIIDVVNPVSIIKLL